MTPPTKHHRILSWIRKKKIGTRFTAKNIAEDTGLTSPEISGLLRWQEKYIRKVRKVPGINVFLWEKIAEVPA